MYKRIKTVLPIFGVIVLLVALCVLLYYGMRYFEMRGGDFQSAEGVSTPGYAEEDERPTVALGGKWYAPRENVETVLLIGLDKFQEEIEQEDSYRNLQQSDFLILALFDHDAHTCTALQVDRDTMAQIHVLGLKGEDLGTFEGQLALSHTYGSGGSDSARNTMRAVSDFLYGIEIDRYISFSMDAVAAINDALGGVTVKVLDDFSNVDPTLVQGETVTLHGEQALTYVRSRRDMQDSSNAARMVRQRQYLTALYAQTERYAQDHSGLADLVVSVSPYIDSDCSAQQLYTLASYVTEYDLTEIQTVKGESKVGEKFMEFYPDEDALTRQVIDLFYEPVDEAE